MHIGTKMLMLVGGKCRTPWSCLKLLLDISIEMPRNNFRQLVHAVLLCYQLAAELLYENISRRYTVCRPQRCRRRRVVSDIVNQEESVAGLEVPADYRQHWKRLELWHRGPASHLEIWHEMWHIWASHNTYVGRKMHYLLF